MADRARHQQLGRQTECSLCGAVVLLAAVAAVVVTLMLPYPPGRRHLREAEAYLTNSVVHVFHMLGRVGTAFAQ